MNSIYLVLWLLPLLSVLFLWALLASRSGRSPAHSRAFYSGAVGLIAIPVWLFGFLGMVVQLAWATFASPAGALFLVGSLSLLGSAIVSSFSLVVLPRAKGAA